MNSLFLLFLMLWLPLPVASLRNDKSRMIGRIQRESWGIPNRNKLINLKKKHRKESIECTCQLVAISKISCDQRLMLIAFTEHIPCIFLKLKAKTWAHYSDLSRGVEMLTNFWKFVLTVKKTTFDSVRLVEDSFLFKIQENSQKFKTLWWQYTSCPSPEALRQMKQNLRTISD